jgi:hypothetical protein
VKRKWLAPLVGLAGLALCAVGGVAILLRPAATVHAVGDLEAPIAVIPPEVVAFDGLLSISVTAPGAFDVRTARPVDVYAWAKDDHTSVVRGLVSWDEVQVDDVNAGGSYFADDDGDLWRDSRHATGETTIDPADVEPGVVIVLVSESGSLGDVTLTLSRDRGNGWAWPVIAGGLSLIVAGLVILAAGLVESQPSTTRERKRKGHDSVKKTSEATKAKADARPKRKATKP